LGIKEAVGKTVGILWNLVRVDVLTHD